MVTNRFLVSASQSAHCTMPDAKSQKWSVPQRLQKYCWVSSLPFFAFPCVAWLDVTF